MSTKKLILIIMILYPIIYLTGFDINKILLPDGFTIEVYAQGLSNPRGLTVAEDDTAYVGSKSGNVYKISPDRKVEIIKQRLNSPIGIDYYKDDLYLSEIDKIRVFKNIQQQKPPYKSNIISSNMPKEKWHGWKYIKVGNDDKIYINIGAPCNTCIPTGYYGTISRMDIDGNNFEIYVSGVRNSVGFDWAPLSGELWFTDNGPDRFGDNIPPDELNRVSEKNQHFGFPYLHGKNIKDPGFYNMINDIQITKPEWELPAHVAALGMRFYTGDMFPDKFKNGVFIAEHGSWNRSSKIGYRISFLQTVNEKIVNYQVFASGWEEDDVVYGRPADIEMLSDGSILVSDDYSGIIFRIFYAEKILSIKK